MIIKTKKSTFVLIPEGKQELFITDVKLVPSGKPQMIEFYYEHENGGTMKETLRLDHPVAVSILSQRCALALGDDVPEGTEIDVNDIPGMFIGQIIVARVEHNESEKDGKTRTYANIKGVFEIREREDDL